MKYSITRSSAPSTAVVGTADMKTHHRIDTSAEDTYIDTLVSAATQYVERHTRRALITQTWLLYLPEFPADEILLPRPPLQSVTSIAYIDTDGDSQTWAAANYEVETDSTPGRIQTAWETTYPSVRAGLYNAVTVTYDAGYGDAASDVPDDLVHAVKLLASSWYENRENVTLSGVPRVLPNAVEQIILNYRVSTVRM